MDKAQVNQYSLTKLVKVCVNAVGPRNRADETSLQEGAPSIHQHSLPSLIILRLKGDDVVFDGVAI